MDRADAIRLLRALAAAGTNTRAPKANAWIQKKALEMGLEGSQFVSALAYAGNEGDEVATRAIFRTLTMP
jgi:hypothetical protein